MNVRDSFITGAEKGTSNKAGTRAIEERKPSKTSGKATGGSPGHWAKEKKAAVTRADSNNKKGGR